MFVTLRDTVRNANGTAGSARSALKPARGITLETRYAKLSEIERNEDGMAEIDCSARALVLLECLGMVVVIKNETLNGVIMMREIAMAIRMMTNKLIQLS
jgi:hypothetical protein